MHTATVLSIEFLKNKTLIEIGSTREIVKDQNSSEYFIKFCKISIS